MIYFARWKIFTILGVCLFGLIFAAPNFLTAQQAKALPSWIPSNQFSLGLDLQGGSHLLLEVQVNQVIKERLESLVDTMRTELRKARIRYGSLGVTATGATVTIKNAAEGEQARQLLQTLESDIGGELVGKLSTPCLTEEEAVQERRLQVAELRAKLPAVKKPEARKLEQIADYLVHKSVWVIGGDGWAYDIGYGGLDHVLATGYNINILVMDTEVYSNTGGQQSKATNLAAAAKFAIAGKSRPKKDLGLMAMAYGNVYVASVAFGAKDAQTMKAFQEAETFDGPSLIIAYSPCIEHGYADISDHLDHQALAVKSGYWPLYRYDPRLRGLGKSAMQLDSKPPFDSLDDYLATENRFRMVKRRDPDRYAALVKEAEDVLERRHAVYGKLAELVPAKQEEG